MCWCSFNNGSIHYQKSVWSVNFIAAYHYAVENWFVVDRMSCAYYSSTKTIWNILHKNAKCAILFRFAKTEQLLARSYLFKFSRYNIITDWATVVVYISKAKSNCLSSVLLWVSDSTCTAFTDSFLSRLHLPMHTCTCATFHILFPPSLVYMNTFVLAHASNTICANPHLYLCNLTHHYMLYQAQTHLHLNRTYASTSSCGCREYWVWQSLLCSHLCWE